MKYFLILLLSVSAALLHAQPGTIDKTYGTANTGTVVSVPINLVLSASAIQPDDKVLLGGADTTIGQFVITRNNKDGSIDSSFGKSGQTIITIIDLLPNIGQTSGWTGIAIQPDGKIVATGWVFHNGFVNNSFDDDIVLARFLPDGTPDASFGSQGRIITDLGYAEIANAIAVQADGKIVVAGYQNTDYNRNSNNSFVVRYNTDGSLDNSFGGNGYVTYTLQRESFAYSLLIQPDGKIVAGGSVGGSPENFFLVRYLPDGTLDASFGNGGAVVTPPLLGGSSSTYINSLALDEKGRIAAGGVISFSSATEVLRYLPDGELDNSFNKNGQLQLTYNGVPYTGSYVSTVLAQPGNKLVVSSIIIGNSSSFYITPVLSGLNEDGSPDSSFGVTGQTLANFAFSDYFADAVMQSDGKIVVAGNDYNYTTFINTYLLTRYYGYPVNVSLAVRIKRFLHNHGITWNGLPAEDKIAYYSVEQSSNSRSGFKQVAKVSGRSNLKDYSITNSNLLQGMNYYRVKAVSTDGTTRYSEVVSADNTANTASVYPNPARDYVTVQGLQTNTTANISIADGSGNVKMRGVSNGAAQYRFQIGNLYPGTYYINITTAGKTEVLKFVKE